MPLASQIIHMTVRLELNGPRGVKYGTGFFHNFEIDSNLVQVIVTNRHVVKGCEELLLTMTERSQSNEPIIGKLNQIKVTNLPAMVTFHPDDDVDLAFIRFAPIHDKFLELEKPPYFRASSREVIARNELIDDMSDIQTIIMVGYPRAIWDSINNFPVVRTGITATPYQYDYNGIPEFLIDSACFQGSSGSPIFLYENSGTYFSKKTNTTHIGHRISLLGILYAGPILDAEIESFSTNIRVTKAKLPMNLGHCIKAQRLDDFEEIIRREMKKSGEI